MLGTLYQGGQHLGRGELHRRSPTLGRREYKEDEDHDRPLQQSHLPLMERGDFLPLAKYISNHNLLFILESMRIVSNSYFILLVRSLERLQIRANSPQRRSKS